MKFVCNEILLTIEKIPALIGLELGTARSVFLRFFLLIYRGSYGHVQTERTLNLPIPEGSIYRLLIISLAASQQSFENDDG